MSITSGLLIRITAAVAFLPVAAGQDASKPQLTARELFYAVSPPATPAPAQPHRAKPLPKVVPPKVTNRPAADTASTPKSEPAPEAPAIPLRRVPDTGPRMTTAISERPLTATTPASRNSLGLRYTLLKRTGDEMVEVAANTVFHAGDRIQFNVQANSPGYLYIIGQGSSGTWKPMFPSAEVENGSNRIEAFHTYTMPPKSRIVFDEQTGTEKIFMVLSREPERDLENLIYSLQGNPPPAGAPQAPKEPALVIASANIEDAMVGRLRRTYARDLVVEKVTAETPGDRKETAVYVVNPTGSADSRVVADLALVHQ